MLARRELLAFRKQLLGWYREHQRELPWRRTKDAYRIWLSEIMLQQTRVAAAIPYYERFVERFPDIATLAGAPPEEVLRVWSGLGYYTRARNLQQAAQQMVAKHGGRFPRTEKEALALPGIGRYTAAAVLSIAYGGTHAVLDGNVARVIARLEALRGDLREARRWEGLQKSADELLEAKFSSDWNQAMMELGAMVCTPRAPRCLFCPVARFCRARKLGVAESLPMQRQKRASIEVTLASAVLLDEEGRTLLLPPPAAAKRNGSENEVAALVSKMWHFPMVRVRKDGISELREFLEKQKLLVEGRPARFEKLSRVRHTVTYRKIEIWGFCVPVPELPVIAGTKVGSLAELSSLSSVAVSNLTRKVARAALAAAGTAPVRSAALSFRATPR